MKLSSEQIGRFRRDIQNYYQLHGRDLPWRRDTRPYYILVSELMLQQTQVSRVMPKFNSFISVFPDFEMLANAQLADVLTEWIGLGYNRRARFLHAAARKIIQDYGGKMPIDRKLLETLPGVGSNTAGAILTYAFNQSVVFIETNIRTVFLHYFFAGKRAVSDAEIAELVGQTLDKNNPREWYWALMDYGAYLKTSDNNISRSRHYKKQSTFAGSQRQMRGELIRKLNIRPYSAKELAQLLPGDERLEPALKGLLSDGLIEKTGQRFYLTGFKRLR